MDGSADFFNQRWLDYTGLALGQALEFGWKGAIHPDDLLRIPEKFEGAVRSEQRFEVEGRIRGSDGTFCWFLVRVNPLQDGSGRVVGWCGTNTDIEDRKRAEEALRASEHTLRLVVDDIPGLVFTATADGEIEFVNKQILDYSGRTLEELKRWQMTDLVHPNDLPRRQISLVRCSPTAQRDPQDRVIRSYVLLSDIDDRKRTEEALRESEQTFRQIVDGIDGLVVIANAEGEIEFANKHVLEYYVNAIEAMANLESKLKELTIATRVVPGWWKLPCATRAQVLTQRACKKYSKPFTPPKLAEWAWGLSISRTIVRNHGGRLWATRNDGPGTTFCFTVQKDQ